MRLYIKSEYMTAIMLFRTVNTSRERIAEARATAKEVYNREIATHVYYHVRYGGAAYQTTDHGARLIIYSQSTRELGAVQVSYFNKINGKYVAFSHVTAYSPDKIYNSMLKGKYINLTQVA
jgi:hypothetical protein